MFPNNYTFNPGVVLDPITMTPMISNGGSITVNPLGVPTRPQQKVWQKMFIQDIPQECSNDLMIKLLKQFGNVKNFKRPTGNRGQLLSFCHFQFETGQEIIRIRRLFQGIRILDRNLQLKVSPETQNFIKEWMNMQRDEWGKKLRAPGMNQAKQYETLQHYHQRQDKKYKNHIQDTIRSINGDVKKFAQERMREEERKQHPKQKEREKRRKQFNEDMKKKFIQKQEHWLKREHQKEREYRKERERQRERQKTKYKKVDREMDIDPNEETHRLTKFQNPERRKTLQREQQQDLDRILEQNPPEPQQQQTQKKPRFTISTQHRNRQIKQGEIVVSLPDIDDQQYGNKDNIKQNKNEMFKDWYNEEQIQDDNKPRIELKIPQLLEGNRQQDQQKRQILLSIAKQVPQNKLDLWQYQIDWDLLAKSVVFQKRIRPWLEKRSVEYMGGVEQKFIALVQKKLLSRSHPDKIIKILKLLIDKDAEEFVIKLWKALVFEFLKLKEGIA